MSHSKMFSQNIKVSVAKIFLKTFPYFSLKTSHVIGSVIGWLAFLVPNKLRFATATNLRLCFPHLSTKEHRKLTRSCLIETGKTLTEASPIWKWNKQRLYKLIRKVHGESLIEDAIIANKGVILAFPHLGTWELLSLYCSSKYPMTTLYRKPRMEQLDNIVKYGRERLGAKLVPADNNGVRAMYKALQKNEMIGILPDQEPTHGTGVFAPFFGIPAYSMTLVSRLARKTNAVVIFGYTRRLSNGRGYEIHFSAAPHDMHHNSLSNSVASLNSGLEKCIREIPEQYQWSYKRFRTRPEGELCVYST